MTQYAIGGQSSGDYKETASSFCTSSPATRRVL
jgi:hypothetical protein